MRKLEYVVGTQGYYTTCNTLKSAKALQEQDSRYTIKPVLTEIIEKVNADPKQMANRIKAYC